MKKYGVNDYMHEGPVAAIGGALLGGLIGGGGTMAGLLSVGGMVGSLIGGIGGSMLGNMMSPKLDLGSQPQQPPASAIPATPSAPAIPAAPATPGSTPTGPPVDSTTGAPFNPGEAGIATATDISKGELARKRRGRVSTILTTPQSRAGVAEGSGDGEIELLGG